MARTSGVLCRLALGRKLVTRKVAVLLFLCWLVSGMCCCGGYLVDGSGCVCSCFFVPFNCGHIRSVDFNYQTVAVHKLFPDPCLHCDYVNDPCYEIPALYRDVLLSRLYIEYLLVYYSNICLPIACICVKFLYRSIILLPLIILYGRMSWMVMLSLAPFYVAKCKLPFYSYCFLYRSLYLLVPYYHALCVPLKPFTC